MRSQIRKLPDINFENNENASRFFAMIKNEYLKKMYQTYFWLFMLVMMYAVYQFILTPFNQTIVAFIADQVVISVLFTVYLLIYFFNLSYNRFTPTIISYLEKELSLLDYNIQRKYKIKRSNLLFISFSIIIFIFILIVIYLNSDGHVISNVLRLLIVFFFTSISIPILRGKLHDIFLVNLRNSYFVQIELRLKLIKHEEVESQMVRIFMTSNKICSKSDQSGHTLYTKISEKRWLLRTNSRNLPRLLSTNYLYFHENASLINFNEHFLNIVSAIREWDISKD